MVTRLATRAAGHRRPITSQLTDAVSLASRRPVEDVDGKCQMRDIGECASKGQEPGGSVEIVKSDIKRELGALVWREREKGGVMCNVNIGAATRAIIFDEQWKTTGEKDPIKTKINDMANLKEGGTKRRINDNMGGAQKI